MTELEKIQTEMDAAIKELQDISDRGAYPNQEANLAIP